MQRFLKRTALLLDGQIAFRGEKGLRVGEVRRADDWTAVADIVTLGGDLVRRIRVDRHTGAISEIP